MFIFSFPNAMEALCFCFCKIKIDWLIKKQVTGIQFFFLENRQVVHTL